MEKIESSDVTKGIGLQRPSNDIDATKFISVESHPMDSRYLIKEDQHNQAINSIMGNDSTHGGLILQKKQTKEVHCYGLDRFSWNQGYNAKYDCQIFEDEEPALVARGGSAVAYAIKKGRGTNG